MTNLKSSARKSPEKQEAAACLNANAGWSVTYELGCCKRAMRASAAAAICSRRFMASASALVSRLPLFSSFPLHHKILPENPVVILKA